MNENIFKKVLSVCSIIVGYFIFLIGGYDEFIRVLLIFNIIDYFTGLIKAVVNKNLNSKKIFIGGYRKILMYVVIIIANTFDGLNDNLFLRESVVMYYISLEVISIFENIAYYVPVPEKLKDVFIQLNEKGENEQ